MKKVILLCVLCLLIVTIVNAKEVIVKIHEVEEEEELGILRSFFVSKSMAEDIRDELNITHDFSSFNGFAADVSEEQLKELERNPKYEVLENRQYHITLDTSIAQISANDTWILQQNGTNLTGLHQTICIIDTGVNYSHPSLGGCYGGNNASSNCKVIGGYDFVNDDDDPIDDHGHGTHVAGIASSNDTTYRGVAPDSKIIAIKMLNATGSGSTADLISAIEWCTNNASIFNITTISMSLGDGTYNNTYCNSVPEKDSIWLAISNNITVTVSAGNCDTSPFTCSEGISTPACIEGVIPVGGVNDADSILYQRGDLWQVLAPGSSITSTLIGGGFGAQSGTSMSAPHVAGAVAILAQFFNLQSNNTLDNLTIISALNQTDTEINDTANSGSIFPRLNLLKAIYSLDTVSPNVTLISPMNNTLSINLNQTFTINISDLQLQNFTFYLWNSTSLVNQSSENQTGQDTQYEINITNLTLGEVYYWTLRAYDGNNITFIANNYTLTMTGISTTINSPTNNSFTNENDTNFSCTSESVVTQDLDNVTFSIYNTTELLYNTTTIISGVLNTTIFNYTLPSETNYSWNCESINNASNSSQTDNYTITYETVVPNLTIETPLPESETISSVERIFYFNVSDSYEDVNCSLLFDSSIKESNVITNYTITNNFTRTLTPATYNWKINCTDKAGNSNVSGTNTFTITTPTISETSSSSSGSSGGGGVTLTQQNGTIDNPILSPELKTGYTNTYKEKETTYFTLLSENHSITLDNISENKINITIRSTPITITMEENSTRKLNLTTPEYLDLQIDIGVITATDVQITIKEINEKNPNYIRSDLEDDNRFSITDTLEEKQKISIQENIRKTLKNIIQKIIEFKKYVIISFIILLIIITIIYIIIKRRSKTVEDLTPQIIKEKVSKKSKAIKNLKETVKKDKNKNSKNQ